MLPRHRESISGTPVANVVPEQTDSWSVKNLFCWFYHPQKRRASSAISETEFWRAPEDDATVPKKEKGWITPDTRKTYALLFPVFLYFVVITIIIPVGPAFLLAVIAENDYPGQDVDDDAISAAISADAAQFSIYLGWTSSFVGLIAVAFWGGISDWKGRKVVVIANCAFATCSSLVASFFAYGLVPKEYLFITQIISGLSGSYPVFLMAAFGMIADSTSLASKAKEFGKLEAAVYFGNFCGPFLGGVLLDNISLWFPYLVAALGNAIVLIYFLFVSETNTSLSHDLKFKNVNILSVMKILLERRSFIYLTIVFTLGFTLLVGYSQVFPLFAYEVFDWSGTNVGQFFSILWLYRAFAVGGFIPLVAYIVGEEKWPPMVTTKCALVAYIGAMILFAIVRVDWTWYLISMLYAIGSTLTISIRGILSNAVSRKRQGVILSAIAALEVLVGLAGAPLVEVVYSQTIETVTGATFYVGVAFGVTSLLVSFFVRRYECSPPDEDKNKGVKSLLDAIEVAVLDPNDGNQYGAVKGEI